MIKRYLVYITLLLMFSIMPSVYAQNEQFFGIGAELFQDPFNKKIIITNIIDNSPAQKSGIAAGSEIVSVDGYKAKKSTLCELIGKIRGEEGTSLKLVIRNGWKWRTVELTREQITINPPVIDETLESYWKQIAPMCFECSKILCKEITDKFSRKYKKTILPVVNYWAGRKVKFEQGYNTCMTCSKENKEFCLVNLLNRESQTTLEDKKIYKVLRNAEGLR